MGCWPGRDGSSNNSNNMISVRRYGFLRALGTALGHYCQPSASPRTDNNDRGLFRGLSKKHEKNRLKNLTFSLFSLYGLHTRNLKKVIGR